MEGVEAREHTVGGAVSWYWRLGLLKVCHGRLSLGEGCLIPVGRVAEGRDGREVRRIMDFMRVAKEARWRVSSGIIGMGSDRLQATDAQLRRCCNSEGSVSLYRETSVLRGTRGD